MQRSQFGLERASEQQAATLGEQVSSAEEPDGCDQRGPATL